VSIEFSLLVLNCGFAVPWLIKHTGLPEIFRLGGSNACASKMDKKAIAARSRINTVVCGHGGRPLNTGDGRDGSGVCSAYGTTDVRKIEHYPKRSGRLSSGLT